jgi:PTS system cellobiose-specific IIC component
MKFTEKFSSVIGKIAQVIENNKYLTVIKNSFTQYMPFIIVGSFASLFNTILCSETVGLAQFEIFQWLTYLSPAFTIINFATMSTMTIALTVLIGINLGRANNQNIVYTGILSFISLITVVPTSVGVVIEGVSGVVDNVIPASSINAQGLFVGMIISVVAIEIYSRFSKVEKIKIKMPEQVPTTIATSFNNLVPILLTLLTLAIFGSLFFHFTGTYISDFIYAVLQRPLESVAQTPFGVIFLALASALFWTLGIHGSLVIMPLLSPLALSGLAANVEAVAAGGQATNVLTMTFFRVYVVGGGAGITISLIAAILLFGKRQEEKEIAKLGLLPGIFGINEPIIFGMPIVLNPIYAIPFIVSQLCATIIGYVATVSGFIPAAVVEVPFGLPILVNAFVGLQTIPAVLVQLIVMAVAFVIYIPFVKISNNIAAKEKLANE